VASLEWAFVRWKERNGLMEAIAISRISSTLPYATPGWPKNRSAGPIFPMVPQSCVEFAI
jgi:hypothetical protein